MKYRLNKNSFVRNFGNVGTVDSFGYVFSQLTKHDRTYDEIGAVFLNALSRTPQTFDEILNKVSPSFIDANINDIATDLKEFLDDLVSDNYLTSGKTEEDINKNELAFSYTMENPKTATFNYLQNKEDISRYADTTEVFYEEFHKRPRIHSCQVEITNKCNERCIHCYIPHEKKNCILDTQTIFSVLEQLHSLGTLGLTISGGEALVHPDIDKILLKASELDFSINLLTNLTLLNDEHIKLLKKVNPSLVQTSLYSMNPDEHDKITKLAGSHIKTLSAIEKLIANEIPVQISCPTMRTNFKSYKAVLEWAAKNRCKAQTDFIMMARFDYSTDNLDERLNMDETKQLISEMLLADVDYGEQIENYTPQKDIEELKKHPVCGVGVDNICLAADGTFYPCSGWQGLPVGCAKTQTVKDVWENSPQLKMLRGIKKASFPKCLQCPDADFCAMCMVRNFNESGGDLLKINNHFCQVAKINKELVLEHIKIKK